MTIAQINYVFDPSLVDPDALLDKYTTLTGWGEALLDAGAARVVTCQRFGRDAEFNRNGVQYVFRRDGGAAKPAWWQWPRHLHRAVADVDPDIAHVNGLEFARLLGRLRRTLHPRTPIVVQDHGGTGPRLGRSARLRRHRPGDVAGYLFTTAVQADSWIKAGVVPPAPLVFDVLEASTSLCPLPRDRARAITKVAGEPAILWVGRLDANKDPLTVIEGFNQSLAALPLATLTMVFGDDAFLASVTTRLNVAASHGGPPLRDRVRLVGHVPHGELAAYYSAADIFVLGSHHEGSGYALIEACACGVVPVVTDIPSFRAITHNGTIGRLWPTGDAAALARGLVDVTLGDIGAERDGVMRHFARALSWKAVGRDALRAYARVVASGSPGASPASA